VVSGRRSAFYPFDGGDGGASEIRLGDTTIYQCLILVGVRNSACWCPTVEPWR